MMTEQSFEPMLSASKMMSLHHRETTSESGVSDLDTMIEGAKCTCCPYGYHIDVDFVRFLNETDTNNTEQYHHQQQQQHSSCGQQQQQLIIENRQNNNNNNNKIDSPRRNSTCNGDPANDLPSLSSGQLDSSDMVQFCDGGVLALDKCTKNMLKTIKRMDEQRNHFKETIMKDELKSRRKRNNFISASSSNIHDNDSTPRSYGATVSDPNKYHPHFKSVGRTSSRLLLSNKNGYYPNKAKQAPTVTQSGIDSCYNSSSGLLPLPTPPSSSTNTDSGGHISSSGSGSGAESVRGSFILDEQRGFPASTHHHRLNDGHKISSEKASGDNDEEYKHVKKTLLQLDRIVEGYLKDLEKGCSSKKRKQLRKVSGPRSRSMELREIVEQCHHRRQHHDEEESQLNISRFHKHNHGRLHTVPIKKVSEKNVAVLKGSRSSSDEDDENISSQSSRLDIRETTSQRLTKSRRWLSIPIDLNKTASAADHPPLQHLPPPPAVSSEHLYRRSDEVRAKSSHTSERLRPLFISESVRYFISDSNSTSKYKCLEDANIRIKQDIEQITHSLEKECVQEVGVRKERETREVGVLHRLVAEKPKSVDKCVQSKTCCESVQTRQLIKESVEEIENVYRERIKVLEGSLRQSQQKPEQRHVNIMFKPDVTNRCLCTDPCGSETREVALQFTPHIQTGDASTQYSTAPEVIQVPMPRPPMRDACTLTIAIPKPTVAQSSTRHCQTVVKRWACKDVQSSWPSKSRAAQCELRPCKIATNQTDTLLSYDKNTGTPTLKTRDQCTVSSQDWPSSEPCLWRRDIGVDTALLLADNVMSVAVCTDNDWDEYQKEVHLLELRLRQREQKTGPDGSSRLQSRGCSPVREICQPVIKPVASCDQKTSTVTMHHIESQVQTCPSVCDAVVDCQEDLLEIMRRENVAEEDIRREAWTPHSSTPTILASPSAGILKKPSSVPTRDLSQDRKTIQFKEEITETVGSIVTSRKLPPETNEKDGFPEQRSSRFVDVDDVQVHDEAHHNEITWKTVLRHSSRQPIEVEPDVGYYSQPPVIASSMDPLLTMADSSAASKHDMSLSCDDDLVELESSTPLVVTDEPLNNVGSQPLDTAGMSSTVTGSMSEYSALYAADDIQDQSDYLDEELYVACVMLNEYLYSPKSANTIKVQSALSLIQQDWFKAATEPNSDVRLVDLYLKAFGNFSKFLLERIVNMVDANENTALHLAVCAGRWDIVDLLLRTGVCDVNLFNAVGYTAVMSAATIDITSENQMRVYRRLFKHGQVNLRAVRTGQSALLIAVEHNKLDIAGLLLETGGQVNLQDHMGQTALMIAIKQKNLKMVKLILGQPNCDVSILDNGGRSAMTLDAARECKQIMCALYTKLSETKCLHSASPSLTSPHSPHVPTQTSTFWSGDAQSSWIHQHRKSEDSPIWSSRCVLRSSVLTRPNPPRPRVVRSPDRQYPEQASEWLYHSSAMSHHR